MRRNLRRLSQLHLVEESESDSSRAQAGSGSFRERFTHQWQLLGQALNRSLVIFFLSPEWAVSSLLRTFVWCAALGPEPPLSTPLHTQPSAHAPPLQPRTRQRCGRCAIWIYEAYALMDRPDYNTWWIIYQDEDATAVINYIEQIFLWMVLLDYAIHLTMAPNKIAYIFSVSSILDLITMPVTALIVDACVQANRAAHYEDCIAAADAAWQPYFDEPAGQRHLNDTLVAMLPYKYGFNIWNTGAGNCGMFDPRPGSFLNQFGWLRFLRLYGTKYTMQKLNIFSSTPLAVISLLLSVVSLFSTFAAVVFWIEAPDYLGGSKLLNFGDFVYFAVVTFTTVGYGDYSPVTWEGMVVVIVGMMVGVVWIPQQVTNLNNAINADRLIVGSLPKQRRPFVLLVGDLLQEQLEMFLAQHFNGSASKLNVVVLSPHSPDTFTLPEVTSQQKSRIAIVQVSPLWADAPPPAASSLAARSPRARRMRERSRAPDTTPAERAWPPRRGRATCSTTRSSTSRPRRSTSAARRPSSSSPTSRRATRRARTTARPRGCSA